VTDGRHLRIDEILALARTVNGTSVYRPLPSLSAWFPVS
jgi:hypothetical protein